MPKVHEMLTRDEADDLWAYFDLADEVGSYEGESPQVTVNDFVNDEMFEKAKRASRTLYLPWPPSLPDVDELVRTLERRGMLPDDD